MAMQHPDNDLINIHFLLYGHRGWIGSHIIKNIKRLQTVSNSKYKIKLSLSKIRVRDRIELEQEIISISPTHIISTLGRTHGISKDGTKIKTIDYLESLDKTQENVMDNLFAPISLALLCIKHDIHLTYLGTGCIFHYEQLLNESNDKNKNYDINQIFTESDKPNFFGSQYSMMKGVTDQLMQIMEYSKNILNVRIRMPITDEIDCHRNLINKLISYKYIVNIPNSMTNLDELLPLMIDMSLTKKYGTIHLVNDGTILHKEILKMYKELIDPKHEWIDISIEELKDKVKKVKAERSNNHLCNKKLKSWYPNRVKPIGDSIRATLMRMKKNNDSSTIIKKKVTSKEPKDKKYQFGLSIFVYIAMICVSVLLYNTQTFYLYK